MDGWAGGRAGGQAGGQGVRLGGREGGGREGGRTAHEILELITYVRVMIFPNKDGHSRLFVYLNES